MRVTNYDSISPRGYEARYRNNRCPGIEAALESFAVESHPDEVLEVGTGTGHWLEFLLHHECWAVGLDLSVAMLDRARQAMPGAALAQGRAETLPFENKTFDRVFCINALHHFTDKQRFLAEVRRVLRPEGGLLSIGLDPHKGQDRWWIYEYFPETVEFDLERYPSTDALRVAMTEAGFGGCATYEVEHIMTIETSESAQAAGYFERSSTSQLTILTDQEFERGAQRIADASGAASSAGMPLELRSDLHLYATLGWIV